MPYTLYAGFGGHHAAHQIDWSKIDPEDRWILLCVLGGVLTFIFCLFTIVLCIDDAPAPEAVRKTVRKQFSAAEKAV